MVEVVEIAQPVSPHRCCEEVSWKVSLQDKVDSLETHCFVEMVFYWPANITDETRYIKAFVTVRHRQCMTGTKRHHEEV